MLKRLRDNKFTVPGGLDDNPEVAEQKWDAILNDIIAGFEASRRIQKLDYERNIVEGMKTDMVTFQKGMTSFVEKYFDLWD